MSVLSQSTIANKVSFSGIGIHTGMNVNVNILPASPNSGIVFKRVDLKKNNVVIPNFENVSEATLCTTVSNQFGVKVSTIEHLMAAFFGLGVDNAIVELDGQELPILDGSAKDFVKILRETGLKNSDIPIKLIKINNSVKVEEDNKFISIEKSNTTKNNPSEITYKLLLETVWVDDILDPSEVQLLARKRGELGLSFERHLQLVRDIIGG